MNKIKLLISILLLFFVHVKKMHGQVTGTTSQNFVRTDIVKVAGKTDPNLISL